MNIQPRKSKELCSGCHCDFYNGHNPLNVKKCWHFKSAKVCRRFRIGFNTPQDRADNFTEVFVLDCYRESGLYAYYERIPDHLQAEYKDNLKAARKAARR